MSTKGTNQMQRQEWVGDAVLDMLVKMILAEDHPEDTVEALVGRVDAFINNGIVSKFCKANRLPIGSNGFERELAAVVETNFPLAKRQVRRLIEFAKSTNAEQRFRERMIHRNQHTDPRPLPCLCGSMNLRVWRKPSKVVCADCSREFVPEKQIHSAQHLIAAWNKVRLAQRVEPAYAG
jgi:hypothetical protein